MAKAKYYVEVDSYWQNSPSIFIGPYASLEDAQKVADASRAVPASQMAPDVKYNVRYEIHNTGQARLVGMKRGNICPALNMKIPGDVEALSHVADIAEAMGDL